MEQVCERCRFWAALTSYSNLLSDMFAPDVIAESAELHCKHADELKAQYPYGDCSCSEFVDISCGGYYFDHGAAEHRKSLPNKSFLYQDGEGCGARFVTRKTFGCIHWEPKE